MTISRSMNIHKKMLNFLFSVVLAVSFAGVSQASDSEGLPNKIYNQSKFFPSVGILRVEDQSLDTERVFYLDLGDLGTYRLLVPQHFLSVALMSRDKKVEVRGRLTKKRAIKVYNIKPL